MHEGRAGLPRALGARPAGAAISHYHDDHADGLSLLGGIETWGSCEFAPTLSLCFPAERRASLAPMHLVRGEPETLRLGGRRVELFPLPGHSPDSLGAVIDGKTVYAADTLLFSNAGEPILPSVHARPVELHAQSLKRLRDFLDLTFVPGHGAPVTERSLREADLANRIAYVEAIAAHQCKGAGISLDEAEAACDPKFIGHEWHAENYR